MIDAEDELLKWFDLNKRDMPWRRDNEESNDQNFSAYRIWVSEIMLQQTKVETVREYYRKWMEKFPTVQDLAKGTSDEVNSLWAGLGYYSRAKNLHKASKIIVNELNGKFPSDVDDLLKLPGIGKYTAGAISSIAFNKKSPLVDGNVIRVFSRLLKRSATRDDKDLIKFCWKVAEENIIKQTRPGDWNQALMELGAIICKPKNPNCSKCPLNLSCKVFLEDKQNIDNYPLPKVKKIIPIEYYEVIVIKNNRSKYLMKRRPSKGLLANQFEFIKILTKTENKTKKNKKSIHQKVDEKKTKLKVKSEENDLKVEKIDEFESFEELLSKLFDESEVLKMKNLDRTSHGSYTHVFSHLKHVLNIKSIEINEREEEMKISEIGLKDGYGWYSEEEMNEKGITKSTLVCLNKSKQKLTTTPGTTTSTKRKRKKKDLKMRKLHEFFRAGAVKTIE